MRQLWLPYTYAYMFLVLFINSIFTYLQPLQFFGTHFMLGDLVVGFIFVARDFAQREVGHKVFIAMFIGCILSYLLADPAIALASMSAFIVSETVDWAVFTFTRKPLGERILFSGFASSPIDSIIFLAMIHQLTLMEWTVLTLGKCVGVTALWWIWRQRARSAEKLPLATSL